MTPPAVFQDLALAPTGTLIPDADGLPHIDIDVYGRITRAQVADLCKLKDNQASKLLLRMRARKLIRINGNPPKGAYYTKI